MKKEHDCGFSLIGQTCKTVSRSRNSKTDRSACKSPELGGLALLMMGDDNPPEVLK